MTLETFTTSEARKMLDYFGWPEELLHYTGLNIVALKGSSGKKINAILAILRDHLWSIIGERFDCEYWKFKAGEKLARHGISLTELDATHSYDAAYYGRAPDLDTLLVKTCTWIMEKEKENG